MYLVGAEHRNKTLILQSIPKFLMKKEVLVTSAECFQEILHRYRAIRNVVDLQIAYEALEALVDTVETITKADVDRARNLVIQFKNLSSRDCLHVSVMKRIGCTRIWTFDAGFDGVTGIIRVK